MQNTINGLIKKRGEIAGQHKAAMKAADAIKADLEAIDRGLVLCGYQGEAAERRKCWAIVLSVITYITNIVYMDRVYNGKYHTYSAFITNEGG